MVERHPLTTDLRAFGRWIKRHREAVNISQETAAGLAGLSRAQWARIENGQSSSKRDTLLRIADAVKADVSKTLEKAGFYSSNKSDLEKFDELIADGLFKGYCDLSEKKRRQARRAIAAVIRFFKDEDFED